MKIATSVLLISVLAAAHASELVLTPKGYWPKSCVHEIESFSEVEKLDNEVLKVRSPDGQVRMIETCKEEIPRGDSGWIVYTYYDASGFTSFNGTWNVPPEPTQQNDQTVFFFTGLENAAGNEIIQPVLQWGKSAAGGAKYWAVANWVVTSGGQALYSKLVQVEDGNTIFGYMVQSGSGWLVGATINGANPTDITVSKLSAQTFSSVTLEAYNILNCNNYPNGGSITFTGLVEENQGQVVSPTWASTARYSSCGEKAEIVSPSEVVLNY